MMEKCAAWTWRLSAMNSLIMNFDDYSRLIDNIKLILRSSPWITNSTLLWSSAMAGLLMMLLLLQVTKQLQMREGRSKKKSGLMKLPPGPRALPIVGNWLQFRGGLTARGLAELAARHGDVCLLRMGRRRVVVVSSPEGAREVLQARGAEFGSRARNLVFDLTTGGGQDMVFADYGDHWRRMRRIATLPFFTHKIVQSSAAAWQAEVEAAVQDLATWTTQDPATSTKGILVRDRLQLMMYNIVYRMMFGRRFDGQDDPLYRQLMALNRDNGRLAQSFKYNYGDFLPALKPLLGGYLRQVWDANQRRLLFLRDAFLNDRKQLLNGLANKIGVFANKIGVDYFLDAHLKGEISENSVLYLIQNMNVAAIETTLWSSEWGIAELVNNPPIQNKLRDELDNVLGKGIPIAEPDITNLPYLQAFIKEILRKHMVIPLLLPHMNLEASKIGDYDVPAGCRILVNAWSIANNPKWWDRPEDFQPERFIENKIDPNGNHFKYIPFGSGRRSCPGSMIALSILGLVLGRLVQAFEILPPLGVDKVSMEEVGSQFSLTLAMKSNVVLKPRDL